MWPWRKNTYVLYTSGKNFCARFPRLALRILLGTLPVIGMILLNILSMWADSFFIFVHGLGYLLSTKYLQIHIHQVPISCVLDIITYLKLYSSLKALKAYLPKFFVLSVVPAQLEPHPPILMKLIFHTFPLLPVNNIYSITNIFLLLSQIILV